jgi:hypothetical protein
MIAEAGSGSKDRFRDRSLCGYKVVREGGVALMGAIAVGALKDAPGTLDGK